VHILLFGYHLRVRFLLHTSRRPYWLCAGWISVQTFCEWWLVAEQSLAIHTFVRSTFPGAALLEHTAAIFRYQVSPPVTTTAAVAALALGNMFRSSGEPSSVCHRSKAGL
jgi:hypothetical protein